MIIDISATPETPSTIWPNDTETTLHHSSKIKNGASVNVGAIQMSLHAGTHVDAELHYKESGAGVDGYDLSVFAGPVLVIEHSSTQNMAPDCTPEGDLPLRILFKTPYSQQPSDKWSPQFPAILPETIEHLAKEGVVLVGTDAPSVDPADSKDLPAHHRLAEHGMVNLENLRLGHVEPGRYRLYAFPLALENTDAAPVRAVLETL